MSDTYLTDIKVEGLRVDQVLSNIDNSQSRADQNNGLEADSEQRQDDDAAGPPRVSKKGKLRGQVNQPVPQAPKIASTGLKR
ncbi:hypothetical protein M408DRAFT_329204 [Serendipita vermifera MAFF 305830]|uniref:Uncharacterized protein n=1 Tax=Serendipita vermifera MAFF 305830 TaxID=933852 RepID=A0A0C3B9G4_SERVB|nr:hypothetical protein M408DRAFT_329204 [Serendipita vermifera MAFF 305830]